VSARVRRLRPLPKWSRRGTGKSGRVKREGEKKDLDVGIALFSLGRGPRQRYQKRLEYSNLGEGQKGAGGDWSSLNQANRAGIRYSHV